MKNVKQRTMRSRVMPLVLLLILLMSVYSCKKEVTEKPPAQSPQNPEVLFDYKGGDAIGYVVGSKWSKSSITWYVEKWCNSLSQRETREMLQKAFKVWSDASTLTFTEVASINQADIVFLFGDNGHWTNSTNGWCPTIFEFKRKNEGVLAHAYNPPQYSFPSNPIAGDVHFCDLHKWSPYGEANNASISLLSVAIHEIGHTIGINHSQDVTAIMHESYNFSKIKYALAKDDIDAVQHLYKAGNNQSSVIRITGVCPAGALVNTSESFLLTINNDGNKTLQVNDISITNNHAGAFSLTNGKPNLPISIPPYGRYDVYVKFSPTAAIQYNSILTVTSDANSGNNTSPLVSVGQSNPTNNNNTFTDPRDGRVYKTKKIGTQTWIAENFNYNQPGSVSFNGVRYYDFQTAIKATPSGFHLPTDEEWQQLEIHEGMSNSEAASDGLRGTDQGYKIVVGGSSGLNLDYNGLAVIDNEGKMNFYMVGQAGYFWTATKNWIGGGFNIYSPKLRSIMKLAPSKISRLNGSLTGNFYTPRYIKD